MEKFVKSSQSEKMTINMRLLISWSLLISCLLLFSLFFFKTANDVLHRSIQESLTSNVALSSADNSSILIVTITLGPGFDVDRIRRNRLNYCAAYKCDVLIETESFNNETSAVWLKFHEYLRYKDSYDYIWFLDADAFIMSKKRSIREIISKYDTGGMMISYLQEQHDKLNLGSFITKTSNWTTSTITEALKYRNRTDIPQVAEDKEQGAIAYLYEQSRDPRFSLVPQPVLDSYLWRWTRVCFSGGDLVVHAAGYHGYGYKVLENYIWFFGYKEV